MRRIKYNLYNILKIKANYPILPRYLEKGFDNSADLTIMKLRKINFEKDKYYGKYVLTETLRESFYGGDNKLYVEQQIKGIKISKFLIENLQGKNTKFVFWRHLPDTISRFLPSSVFDPEIIFQHILQIKLLQKNHTLIHAGVLTENKKAYALVGWSNVGKSTTTYILHKEYGFGILSDSLPIISPSGKIYSIGETGQFTWKNGKKIFFNYTARQAKLNKIFFLMKHPRPFIKNVNPEVLINKIIVSTYKAIESVLSRRVLLAYSLLNDYPIFSKNEKRMFEILKKALKNVKCFIVGGNRNNFYKFIAIKIL